MNRPYQFYYFVPLITFWFVIMFATFKIIPHVTSHSAEGLLLCIGSGCKTQTDKVILSLLANSSHYFYVILKMITLFSIVSLLYTSEVFFENVFLIRPWKALFVTTDDSIKEWWFRWKIDRYVCLCLIYFIHSTSCFSECSIWNGIFVWILYAEEVQSDS